ncbi:hypothetical protein GCM10010279_15560 [Streptomyces mutabilis]|nr:hypothetical protein GCM10010279_15560 [Streptomyces mutabilis]
MISTCEGAFFIFRIDFSAVGQPPGVLLTERERNHPMRAVRRVATVLTSTATLIAAFAAEAAAVGIDLGGGLTL